MTDAATKLVCKQIAEEHKKTAGSGPNSASGQAHGTPMCNILVVPMGNFKQTLKYTFIKTFEGVAPETVQNAIDNIYTDFIEVLREKDFSKKGQKGTKGSAGWDYWIREDNEQYRAKMRADRAVLDVGTDVAIIMGKYEALKNWKKLSSNPFFIKICRKYTTNLKGQDQSIFEAGSVPAAATPTGVAGSQTRHDKELALLGGVQEGLTKGSKKKGTQRANPDYDIYKDKATGFQGEIGSTGHGGIGSASIRAEQIGAFSETGEVTDANGRKIPVPKKVRDAVLDITQEFKRRMKYTVDRKALLENFKELKQSHRGVIVLLGTEGNQINSLEEHAFNEVLQNNIENLASIVCGGPAELTKALTLFNLTKKTGPETTLNIGSDGVGPKSKAKSKDEAKIEITHKHKRKYKKQTSGGLVVAGIEKLIGTARKKRKATERARPGPSKNPLRLMVLINRELPETVRGNMEPPRLTNRTGTFARSTRLTDVRMTSGDFPSFGYTYQRDPYGVHEQDVDFDPRTLIDASIREIAAQYAIGRFYTRRV